MTATNPLNSSSIYEHARIAVLLPCFNEGKAITHVVKSFRDVIPSAEIVVIDNASKDDTAEKARAAGATVISELLPGKGNAVRRGFSEVEADIYVMADGDGTYDAKALPDLINRLVSERLDMVVGTRAEKEEAAYRSGHRMGNRLFNSVFARLFGARFTDIFSGYRVFSRRFVKTFPAISTGFEIETEISVHAIMLRAPVAEIPTSYGARHEGTESKLRTYRDGTRILSRILLFTATHKPFVFYGLIAAALATLSVLLGLPLIFEYLETGIVSRLPTAVLTVGIMISAVLSFVTGAILSNIGIGQWEVKRLSYLLHTDRLETIRTALENSAAK
ncbi:MULTISPECIES: glycosyltransferase [unclassified Thalassospira]|uniref:glycosyltransferase n=1 Tax=unclassified Thalassospira TaxID=2648997 RepID=UPI001B2C65C0|nr:glycosyltransferase [Thalassospira sp.]MBO6772169.1 glycosyltransferase [Thalassospira sp.]